MYRIVTIFSVLFMLVLFEVLQQKQNKFDINFYQKDYNLTTERIQVVHNDPKYVNIYEVATFKYNRSATAFNITLNYKFDITKMEVVLQTYRFASNEYRLFPLRFQINFCKAQKANVAGLAKHPCGNMTGCPMLQGKTYHICNWMPDPSKYPPNIPSGRYLLEVEYFYGSIEVSLVRVYVSVTRPEV